MVALGLVSSDIVPELKAHTTILQIPLKMRSPKRNLTLLSIPVEIRDMIYNNLLIGAQSINLSIGLQQNELNDDSRQATRSFQALSQTCTQTHAEVEDIYFSQNRFRLLANRPLPSIPCRYARRMKKITLYRTLLGRDFLLHLRLACKDRASTSVEVVGCQESSTKEEAYPGAHAIERMITFRLTQGAEVAARMLQQMVADRGGLTLEVLKAVATQMNQQWVVAM